MTYKERITAWWRKYSSHEQDIIVVLAVFLLFVLFSTTPLIDVIIQSNGTAEIHIRPTSGFSSAEEAQGFCAADKYYMDCDLDMHNHSLFNITNVTADAFYGNISCGYITGNTTDLCSMTDADFTNVAYTNESNTFTENQAVNGSVIINETGGIYSITIENGSIAASNGTNTLWNISRDGKLKLYFTTGDEYDEGVVFKSGADNQLWVRNAEDDGWGSFEAGFAKIYTQLRSPDLFSINPESYLKIHTWGADTDDPVGDLSIYGGNALSTATTNMDGGNVVLYGGKNASAGGVQGQVIIYEADGTTEIAHFDNTSVEFSQRTDILDDLRVGAVTGESITMDGDDAFILDKLEVGGNLTIGGNIEDNITYSNGAYEYYNSDEDVLVFVG